MIIAIISNKGKANHTPYMPNASAIIIAAGIIIINCLNNVMINDLIPSPSPSNTPENTIGIDEKETIIILYYA